MRGLVRQTVVRSAWRAAVGRLGLAAALLLVDVSWSVAEQNPVVPSAVVAPSPRPVLTLGDNEQKLFVVKYDRSWSMHGESLDTSALFRLWQEAGGPKMVTKTIVDRPYTISVHSLSAEDIVERLLDGYGYTLHYDSKGRLELVRVYSPIAGHLFKTPRLVESLGTWRSLETPVLPTAAEPGTLPAAPPATSSDVPSATLPATLPSDGREP